jgi:hypothetical protein
MGEESPLLAGPARPRRRVALFAIASSCAVFLLVGGFAINTYLTVRS